MILVGICFLTTDAEKAIVSSKNFVSPYRTAEKSEGHGTYVVEKDLLTLHTYIYIYTLIYIYNISSFSLLLFFFNSWVSTSVFSLFSTSLERMIHLKFEFFNRNYMKAGDWGISEKLVTANFKIHVILSRTHWALIQHF